MRIKFIILLLAILYFSGCGEPSSAPPGCCAFPAIDVKVGNAHIYVPNVFTPDGNGINDSITLFGDSVIDIISMVIYDSNHNRVIRKNNFLSNDPSQGWDGK